MAKPSQDIIDEYDSIAGDDFERGDNQSKMYESIKSPSKDGWNFQLPSNLGGKRQPATKQDDSLQIDENSDMHVFTECTADEKSVFV